MASSGGLATAFNVAIACSAIFGNGLVIFVMTVRRKHFKSFSNRLIRHQSIIDFVSGLVFLLMTGIKQTSLLENLEGNVFGVFLCRFIYSDFFVWGLSSVSTYNLVVISLERFLATCYPVKHRNYCSLFKIKISMCAAWIIGFMYALTFVFVYTVKWNRCIIIYAISRNFVVAMIPYVIIICEYIIPVILMSFSYIKILLVLRHKIDNANANQQDGVFSKAKRNVIMTMLIAGCMFFICWTPVETLRLLLAVGVIVTDQKTFSVKYASDAFTALVMCNMSVNPAVYCFKYEHFRTQLKQLVRSRFGRNRVRPGEESNHGLTLSVPAATRSTAPVN
ncbi:probable G-protein coupled receptor 83 [Asterias rubens]|uniref:probable G-protein coupled receptor 83 n=1 Tax=Asterias rubens TaxID=7604 RepID=UPI0014555B0A|nr:probable G-protein coupled receptor 83 [Asterias rubens]